MGKMPTTFVRRRTSAKATRSLARPDTDLEELALVEAHCDPGRHLGDALKLLAEPDSARTHYRRALEAGEQVGFRPEIALTRLALADLLLQSYPDERDETIAHLDFVVDEFRAMKMQPSLERALSRREILKA